MRLGFLFYIRQRTAKPLRRAFVYTTGNFSILYRKMLEIGNICLKIKSFLIVKVAALKYRKDEEKKPFYRF